MTDQEYAQMMNDAVAVDELESALEKLTLLHQECHCRTMEFWSGKRTRRSIQSRKFTATVNAVREKFGVYVTYTRHNRYEVKNG